MYKITITFENRPNFKRRKERPRLRWIGDVQMDLKHADIST